MLRSLFLVFLVSTTACRRRPPPVAAAPPAPAGQAGHVVPAPVPVPYSEVQEAVAQVAANFARVHFAVDASHLDDEAMAALADNAGILWDHPSIHVEIQGHADARGTVDYNLALGQRRAEAVRRALTAMGVEPERLRIISYGEERPLDAAATEVAWSRNRRCEFRVTAGSGAAGTTAR